MLQTLSLYGGQICLTRFGQLGSAQMFSSWPLRSWSEHVPTLDISGPFKESSCYRSYSHFLSSSLLAISGFYKLWSLFVSMVLLFQCPAVKLHLHVSQLCLQQTGAWPADKHQRAKPSGWPTIVKLNHEAGWQMLGTDHQSFKYHLSHSISCELLQVWAQSTVGVGIVF